MGIVCKVNPEYKEHLRYENGKKVLYILVLRAIFGCIDSTLLLYILFSTTLEGLCFEINSYDRCVANNMIEGTYFTIV